MTDLPFDRSLPFPPRRQRRMMTTHNLGSVQVESNDRRYLDIATLQPLPPPPPLTYPVFDANGLPFAVLLKEEVALIKACQDCVVLLNEGGVEEVGGR